MRSDYLVHWTAKGFDSDGQFARLKEILKNGLALRLQREDVFGKKGFGIQVPWPYVSFTEIRLTQVTGHAERYGPLGLVFTRGWIIQRRGAPVVYMHSDRSKGQGSNIFAGNLHDVLLFFNQLSLREKDLTSEIKKLSNYLLAVASFFKPMGTETPFEHLDEQEWRIVHLHDLESEGLVEKNGKRPSGEQWAQSEEKEFFYLTGIPQALRGIVCPADVKMKILQDKDLKESLKDFEDCFVLTLESTKHF